MICEIDPAQRERARQAAAQVFPDAEIQVLADLAGHPRYLTVERTTKEASQSNR